MLYDAYMAPNHYIYPLNPGVGYEFDDGSPTSLEGFFGTVNFRTRVEWSLSTNFKQIAKDDFVWIYFCSPVQKILAVGKVAEKPHFNEKWQKHAMYIRWSKPLTTNLLNRPIEINQRIPAGASTPNNESKRAISSWMRGTKLTVVGNTKVKKLKLTSIQVRLGQRQFRETLVDAYGGTCAVTKCKVLDTLQAAHITPISADGSNAASNGILLRADIHNLFDRGLIVIDDRYRVLVSRSISDQKYRKLHNSKLLIPRDTSKHPDHDALQRHRRSSLLAIL